jgi:prepilin peptidase CpaA
VSGRIDLLTTVICGVALVAAVTDLRRGKIYNALTLPAALFGLGYAVWWGGGVALLEAFLALLAALALYGWLYWLDILGAGDVKLLMAFGALGGTLTYVAHVALAGVLLGGALAFAVLLVKGKLPDFLRRMRDFLYGLFVKELEFLPPKVDRRERMPFGIPIAIAAVGVRLFAGRLW